MTSQTRFASWRLTARNAKQRQLKSLPLVTIQSRNRSKHRLRTQRKAAKLSYIKAFRLGRDGETGRRSGLKIRRPERVVGVRFPLPAPSNTLPEAGLSISLNFLWRAVRSLGIAVCAQT